MGLIYTAARSQPPRCDFVIRHGTIRVSLAPLVRSLGQRAPPHMEMVPVVAHEEFHVWQIVADDCGGYGFHGPPTLPTSSKSAPGIGRVPCICATRRSYRREREIATPFAPNPGLCPARRR